MFVVIILILLLNTFQNNAQEPGSKRIYSLAECIQIAKSNNYDLRVNEARMRKSGAQITSAFGNYLPSISINMGYQRDLNPIGVRTVDVGGSPFVIPAEDPNSYSSRISATLPIFDGFNREALFSMSQSDYNTNSLISMYTFKKIEYDVYSQYIDVIRLMKIINIRQENITLGKKQLEKIQAQYQAGVVPISNVYAQEAELGNMEYNLVTSENELENAKSVLMTTMGMQPDIDAEFLESSLPVTINDDETLRFRKSIGSYGAAINDALKNRLDYSASQSTVESAKSNLTIARSGYFPKLYVTGGWYWNGRNLRRMTFNSGSSLLNLSLSVPIFENFDANYNIQNAQLTVTQQEVELKQHEQNIRSAVRVSYLNLEAAEKQLEITERTVKSSQENYNSTKERYDIGAANITELFQANNQLINSQINRVTAVYSYLKAQKYVLYVTGNL